MTSTRKHLVIPDCQIKPGVRTDFLRWIGNYIVAKKPDVIINMGDFADMYSLNMYDRGKKGFEGARYHEDISASHAAMQTLMQPYWDYVSKLKRNKKGDSWNPRWVLTLGNHENRINRAIDKDIHTLDQLISTEDLDYAGFGWEVHDFLETVSIDGILYSHYFPRGPSGRVMQSYRGASNARLQIQREHQSATAGHMQGFDYAELQCQDRVLHGLIAGSCYLHDEDYLTPQGTAYWRGIIMKHEVHEGSYDLMKVSLDFLEKKYDY